MFRWPLMLPLLVPSWAHARPMSLADAVALAVQHQSVLESEHSLDQATAAVHTAQAAFDPALSASLGADTSQSQGFIAGLPSSSDSEGWDASLGVAGATAVGTAWSLTTGFDRDVTTTLAALTGADPEPIEQATWSTSVSVSVTQDVLAFLRSSQQKVNVRQARERLDRAELAVLQSTEEAVVAVAEAWWAWWAAEEATDVSTRALAQADALLLQTQAWFDEGEVARLEVDRVHADRLAAERDLLRARDTARAAADDLLVTVGLEPGQDIEITGPERVWTTGELDIDTSVATVLDGNLQLAGLRLDLDAARFGLDDAREQRLPSLDVTGTAGLSTLTADAGDAFNLLSDSNNPRATILLGLEVPLGGRAARAARSDADADVAIKRLGLESTRRQLTASTRAAVRAVATAERGVELAQARLEVARATEDGERARVEEGVRRLDELLVAVQSRQSAEADEVSARVEHARAELDLARLEGRAVAEVLDVD